MRFTAVAAIILTLLATNAWSHSSVTSSVPTNGATLTNHPETIEVTFSKPTRIIKATINYNDVTSTPLTISTTEPTRKITFSPAPTIAGSYKIEWRALADDGHVFKESISFSILDVN